MALVKTIDMATYYVGIRSNASPYNHGVIIYRVWMRIK